MLMWESADGAATRATRHIAGTVRPPPRPARPATPAGAPAGGGVPAGENGPGATELLEAIVTFGIVSAVSLSQGVPALGADPAPARAPRSAAETSIVTLHATVRRRTHAGIRILSRYFTVSVTFTT